MSFRVLSFGHNSLTRVCRGGALCNLKLFGPRQTSADCFRRSLSVSSPLFSGRLYTEKHEWVLVEGDFGVVGISNYAQEALGDVVFAQLPDVGSILTQKDECGALESVKAASELFSPVSGAVVEKNSAVEDTPSLINTSCYDKGWLFKVKISQTTEINSLMDESQYKKYLNDADH